LHGPQQPTPPPELQSSPLGRHESSVSSSQRAAVQRPEQQSLGSTQSAPVFAQTPVAQTPPRHASEQQSCAREHAVPMRLQ
jgi:hypothetical protein